MTRQDNTETVDTEVRQLHEAQAFQRYANDTGKWYQAKDRLYEKQPRVSDYPDWLRNLLARTDDLSNAVTGIFGSLEDRSRDYFSELPEPWTDRAQITLSLAAWTAAIAQASLRTRRGEVREVRHQLGELYPLAEATLIESIVNRLTGRRPASYELAQAIHSETSEDFGPLGQQEQLREAIEPFLTDQEKDDHTWLEDRDRLTESLEVLSFVPLYEVAQVALRITSAEAS